MPEKENTWRTSTSQRNLLLAQFEHILPYLKTLGQIQSELYHLMCKWLQIYSYIYITFMNEAKCVSFLHHSTTKLFYFILSFFYSLLPQAHTIGFSQGSAILHFWQDWKFLHFYWNQPRNGFAYSAENVQKLHTSSLSPFHNILKFSSDNQCWKYAL